MSPPITPTGIYVADANYFTTAHSSGPLTAPSSAASGGNGVFAVWVGHRISDRQLPGQPTTGSMSSSTSRPSTPCRSPTTTTALRSIYNTPFSLAASALLANDTDPDGDPLTVTGVGGATHGTVRIRQPDRHGHVHADVGLQRGGKLHLRHIGRPGGTASATVNMTVGAATDGAEPVLDLGHAQRCFPSNDADSVELGVKFSASSDGTIAGLRYYKGAQDTGTHTGSLWTSTGRCSPPPPSPMKARAAGRR